MSGSGGRGAEGAVSLRRIVTAGVVALVAPLAVGVGIAFTQPGHNVRLEGIGPFLAVCLILVAFAAVVAFNAGAAPLAIGTMSGIAFAIGAIVRDGSSLGALIALGAGAAGGALAASRLPGRTPPRGAFVALLIIVFVLGTPMGLLARVGPVAAASSFYGSEALASATPRGRLASGYVLYGTVGRFLEGASLVRVVPRGLGSWAVAGTIQLRSECRLPDRVDGTELPWFPRSFQDAYWGVRIESSEIERVCWLLGERVVVGIAPPETRKIDVSTISGEEVDVPVGVGGAYIVLLEEDTIASTFVRILFRDRLGGVIDSKPIPDLGDYANLAYLSGLTTGDFPSDRPAEHSVIVSKHVLTPAEFLRLCGEEPPWGDGFVTIGVVKRDDGVAREVVLGTGMPRSSVHPEPDPPIVRPSDGRPCFAL